MNVFQLSFYKRKNEQLHLQYVICITKINASSLQTPFVIKMYICYIRKFY